MTHMKYRLSSRVLQFEVIRTDPYVLAENSLLNCSGDLSVGSGIGGMGFPARTGTYPHDLISCFIFWEYWLYLGQGGV